MRNHVLAALLTAALLTAILGLPGPAVAQQPRPRIEVTRWVLSHGRWDDLRSRGIQTPDNPNGLVVPGITPRVLPFGVTWPPDEPPPPTVLEVIANNPRVTLDADRDGKPDGAENPLILAGALIPSGFTLAIAEEIDPAGDFSWEVPRPRFGGGNIYATVTIPGTEIVAGMELVTPAQLAAYRANSVIYEAPDVGLAPHVQDSALDGGTKNIIATAAIQGSRRTLSRLIGYANPLEVNIVEVDQFKCDGGTCITVRAVLDNLFEPAATDVFRWAVEANSGTLIADVVGTDVFTFTLPIEEPGDDVGGPRFTPPDSMVKLTVVVSQRESDGASPFVNAIPPTPPRQSVSMYTFVSRMPTISDTETVQVRPRSADHSICILLDASGSMADNNRMEQAKNSAMRVLSRLDSRTEVALIVYYDCGRIVVEHEFTTDHQKVLAILPRIQPSGSTPLAAGTAFAKDYMRKHASGTKLDLIILTDGKETCGGDPAAAARQ